MLSALLAGLLLLRMLRQPPLALRAGGAGADADSPLATARARAAGCVAWRATRCGSVLAARLPLEDLPCYARINPRAKHISGACTSAHARGRHLLQLY